MYLIKTVAIGLVLVLLGTCSSSAATVQGLWSMSLSSDSAVSTRGKTGGTDFELEGSYTGVSGAVGQAIRFEYSGRPALGTATSSASFNPGTAPFAVAAYFKTSTVPTRGDYSPNVVQKGLYSSAGQWKMQLKGTTGGTVAGCRFVGSRLTNGALVADRTNTPLNDSHWHEVVCWREASRFGITVDGVNTVRMGELGVISTSSPLRIANKSPTAGIEDQFEGILDCVAYVDGSSPRATAEARVPC